MLAPLRHRIVRVATDNQRSGARCRMHSISGKSDGRAPCKGGAFQWVQAPRGNRSSRKQSEQSKKPSDVPTPPTLVTTHEWGRGQEIDLTQGRIAAPWSGCPRW